jgi:hypothetical protein
VYNCPGKEVVRPEELEDKADSDPKSLSKREVVKNV